jgi:hypothetical protein
VAARRSGPPPSGKFRKVQENIRVVAVNLCLEVFIGKMHFDDNIQPARTVADKEMIRAVLDPLDCLPLGHYPKASVDVVSANIGDPVMSAKTVRFLYTSNFKTAHKPFEIKKFPPVR